MISPLEPGRYGSASAFHAALETRLREVSGGDPLRLNLMRVQFAVGRLLTRLELARPGEWIAKGGTSLLARFDGQCRLSRDLDLHWRRLEAGESGLVEAVATDAQDWLRYRIDRVGPLRQEGSVGEKAKVVATLDHRDIAQFDVDMVEEADPIGSVVRRRPYLPLGLRGAPDPEIPLYPLEDHIADKVAAMGRTRRRGDVVVASTRYRDLVDLALFSASAGVEAAPLVAALAEPKRRWAREAFGGTGLRLPSPEWPAMYVKTVRAEPLVKQRWPTAEAALAVAKPLVDPALAGEARGNWDPAAAAWRD